MSKEYKDDEFDFVNVNIGSQSDCTGMIPTVPLDEAQQDGYSDIYPVQQQIGTAARNSNTPEEQKRKSSRKGK
jgi:hypothetical protein